MGDQKEFELPGLKCGHCGATLTKVHRSRPRPGFMTRERRCLKCGWINTTGERVLSTRQIYSRFSDPCGE